MYDRNRLASGLGVLFALWAVVGLLVLSTGVGVSIPLSGSGGFNLTATYFGASESRATPAVTNETGAPATTFEVEKSYAQELQLEKTLNFSSIAGVDGNLRLLIQADEARIDGAMYKTNHVDAQSATWRGFVLDERAESATTDQFQSYAGPNPSSSLNTDDTVSIAGSTSGAVEPGEQPAFELHDARIEMSKLTADQVSLENLVLVVQYDIDSDGTYEYGT